MVGVYYCFFYRSYSFKDAIEFYLSMEKKIAVAIICNNCGYAYNSDDADRCAICDAPIQPANNINLPRAAGFLDQNGDTASPPPSQPSSIPDGGPDNLASPASSASNQESAQNILDGRISHLERYDETVPNDFYRVMSRILIGLLILAPYVALFVVSGIISFAFGFLGFSSLSQMFNPIIWSTTVFELLEVLALRRIRGTDTVPIYRGMVENNNSREYAFMLRGPLDLGNLVMGHHVRLLGEWKQGTFIARQGSDLTTETAIVSGYRNPWRIIFFVVLCLEVMLGLGVFLYC